MLVLLVLFGLSSISPVSAQDAPQYTIKDLIKAHDVEHEANGLGGYTITGDGVVVGFTGQSAIKSSPFVTVDGKPERLKTNGKYGATAADINSAGVVVGRERTDQIENGFFVGFPAMWVDGELSRLELPLDALGQAAINGAARSINDAGLIAGYLQYPGDQIQHVVVWNNGVGTLLPYAFDYPYCDAYGLSEAGLIAGQCYDSTSGGFVPVIWQGGGVTPVFGAPSPFTEMWGITDTASGGYVAVGFSYATNQDVLTEKSATVITDGVAAALPAVTGASFCQAMSVSETADGILIGGTCETTVTNDDGLFTDSVAVAWLDGELIDLSQAIPQDKGWKLFMIRGVNSEGQMVGIGEKEGERRSFILTPVN